MVRKMLKKAYLKNHKKLRYSVMQISTKFGEVYWSDNVPYKKLP